MALWEKYADVNIVDIQIREKQHVTAKNGTAQNTAHMNGQMKLENVIDLKNSRR